MLAQLIGALVFLCRAPAPATPRFSPTPQSQPSDLADYRNGARVRVSGYDWFRSHHPLFAIDGQMRPTALEKWASLRGDERPWLEVTLPTPQDVAAVDLVFAAAFEHRDYIVHAYRLSCWRGESQLASAEVRENRLPRPSHPLPCPQTDRIRIDFETEPGTPRDVVRLYEVDLAAAPAGGGS